MYPKQLHLIEPTLFDQTGHGFSYAHSILQANKDFAFQIQVWLDRRGINLLSNNLCITRAYFWRPLRQLQKIFLYFKLMRTRDSIFISTCDLWDLKILAFYQRCLRSKASVFLHFHQFKQTRKKLHALSKLATAGRNFHILTPTAKLTQIFSTHGFANSTVMPCPTFAPLRQVSTEGVGFNKLLYAGAARSDKGFPLVIRLLQELRATNNITPFEIQISAPNSQRYDQETTAAMQLLQTIPKVNLTLHRNTLNQDQYLNLFNNAICLLLYDQQSYQDKFSGIALDAFYSGCPIITVRDTWMGDTAEKYSAGIALTNCELATIQAAVTTIINNYAYYTANAKAAALELTALHDPRNTLAYVTQQLG